MPPILRCLYDIATPARLEREVPHGIAIVAYPLPPQSWARFTSTSWTSGLELSIRVVGSDRPSQIRRLRGPRACFSPCLYRQGNIPSLPIIMPLLTRATWPEWPGFPERVKRPLMINQTFNRILVGFAYRLKSSRVVVSPLWWVPYCAMEKGIRSSYLRRPAVYMRTLATTVKFPSRLSKTAWSSASCLRC